MLNVNFFLILVYLMLIFKFSCVKVLMENVCFKCFVWFVFYYRFFYFIYVVIEFCCI